MREGGGEGGREVGGRERGREGGASEKAREGGRVQGREVREEGSRKCRG